MPGGGRCHLYRCHSTIVPAWLLFVQYKRKTVTLNLVNEFFCAILPKTWTHARIIQQPQSIHGTQASMSQFICAHKTWSDGGETSNHTNSWKPCNTNRIHHTQSQTFLFFLSFFLIFVPWAIPQTDSKFSQFHIFLNEATLLLAIFKNWENVKFGLGDHELVYECGIFNA